MLLGCYSPTTIVMTTSALPPMVQWRNDGDGGCQCTTFDERLVVRVVTVTPPETPYTFGTKHDTVGSSNGTVSSIGTGPYYCNAAVVTMPSDNDSVLNFSGSYSSVLVVIVVVAVVYDWKILYHIYDVLLKTPLS